MDTPKTGHAVVRVIASSKNWIEGAALQQLQQTAQWPGMELVVGMPDLHPGKGHPIGATFITKEIIYPHLVGNDIGCGMGVWKTSGNRRKMPVARFLKKLKGLEESWSGNTTQWLEKFGLSHSLYGHSLGTIGGGNHFAEMQVIDHIEDESHFRQLGLDKDAIYLLVHSGSRGLGEEILKKHISEYGVKGLEEDSLAGQAYLERHNEAVRWAKANRSLISERFLSLLGLEGDNVLDVCHNYVTPYLDCEKQFWIHRKGATPSTQGPIMIPGSRGTLSYLVLPQGDQSYNGFSLAHGAGRKWTRTDSVHRLKGRFTPQSLTKTKLGSWVICEDNSLIYEEAPQAYKDIDVVINDMVDLGLIRVIAVFRPIITYKTRRSS